MLYKYKIDFDNNARPKALLWVIQDIYSVAVAFIEAAQKLVTNVLDEVTNFLRRFRRAACSWVPGILEDVCLEFVYNGNMIENSN